MKRITKQKYRTLGELSWGDKWVSGNDLYADTCTLKAMVREKLLRKRKMRPLWGGGKSRTQYQITAKGLKIHSALDNPRCVVRLLDEIKVILARRN